MKRSKFIILVILVTFIAGCVTIPAGFLKPDEGYLQKREMQMRQYETTNENQILSAVAGELQDLGFTLDDSETQVGFIAASKKADAVSKGQLAGAIFLDLLAAAGGSYSNNTAQCDKTQVIKASVITKPSLEGKKTVVRVTFQSIVWNMNGQVSRVETINDIAMYQKFFDSLSKAIFLEAQKI